MAFTSASERTAFSAVLTACGSRSSATSRRPFHASAIWSASAGPPFDDQPVKITARGGASAASSSARRTAARQIELIRCRPSSPISW
jgi:hypothetical protein